ncbi:MAG: alpha/beta fold hydrolase [Isosphaeraceae bacterium]|nr:alpha/beta fold hydrolase [Isosphaeraceae bacterium]
MSFAHLFIAVAVVGWSDVGIAPSRGDKPNATFQRFLETLDRPTDRTMETLKRLDLESRYRRDVPGTIMALEKRATAVCDPDIVYALAEISWVEGARLDRRRKAEALDRYIDAVAFAYDFLFEPDCAAGRDPSDPRFRNACDLYNGGLDRLIRAAQSNGRVEPEGLIRLKVHGREQIFRVSLDPKTPWKANDVDQLLLCSDFVVSGLPTRTYRWGLGVPMIGVRKSDTAGPGEEKFYPPEMAFALTAFLKPKSRLREAGQLPGVTRECTLELIDPVRVHTVGSQPVMALESDLTTPLAYMWSRTDLSRYRWTGLLRPGEAAERAGLMLLRPYEPGKIPVVMVHGLASSPLAWIPMINDLLRDPTIQENYQFLLYVYPTGVSLPIAAAGLRDALKQAEKTFDPSGSDEKFAKMVLLGHSMGGLLSHAMVVHSDQRFWQLNTDQTFDEMLGPPEVLAELRRYFLFEPVPFIKRVVFLAAPHRGSEMSRGFVGRLGSGLIAEPDHIVKLLGRLVRDNPNAFDRRQFRRLPTSIDTLEPNSPELTALLSMRPGADVVMHSIIGSLRPGPVETTTDGVVPYRSSHLDGVASETIVRSDHGVQKAPLAIEEVQRILLLHIGMQRGTPATARAPEVAPVR